MGAAGEPELILWVAEARRPSDGEAAARLQEIAAEDLPREYPCERCQEVVSSPV